MRKKAVQTNIMPQGFFRLNIRNSDGKLVGKSGWNKNNTTNTGIEHYLVDLMLAQAGSLRVSHIALGTGGAPADADTSLSGELQKRKAITTAKLASKTAQFTATFASSDSFVTSPSTVQLNNIGLFPTSTVNGGSIMAGNTFSSSQLASNQQVEVTYQIRFATV
jgi:hypothetical protein